MAPRSLLPLDTAVIVNPYSGQFRTNKTKLDSFISAAKNLGTRVYCPNSYDGLNATALELRTADRIVIAGGDGTLMRTLTALDAALCPTTPSATMRDATASLSALPWPQIGVIPCGTAATIARNWGVRGSSDLVKTLAHCLELPRTATKRQQTLRVSTSLGQSTDAKATTQNASYVGCIAAAGLVSSFFEVYDSQGAGGYLHAAKIASKIIRDAFISGPLAEQILSPRPFELLLDGQSQGNGPWSLFCVSTVPDVAVHVLVNYRANESPEKLHVVASQLGPKELAKRTHKVLLGQPLGGQGAVDQLAKTITVRYPAPARFILDGDTLSVDSFSLRPGPSIDVVTPV